MDGEIVQKIARVVEDWHLNQLNGNQAIARISDVLRDNNYWEKKSELIKAIRCQCRVCQKEGGPCNADDGYNGYCRSCQLEGWDK